MTDLREAAERMALVLSRAGMQRMTARALGAFLFTDQPSVTAGDLAAELSASTGSVSAAIKALSSVGLIERVPAPGSRREHYRMRDDAWATLFTAQNTVLAAMQEAAGQGVAATQPGSPARRRIEDMRDFYAFLLDEIPAILDRWHQR